ncbi:MAG: hypothetical protein WA477_20160 [Candidatus Sulfotelmatobacter sp.]
MPRGRSTFTKRQKEQTRQQRQRDKAERRTQRKQEKSEPGSVDDLSLLHEAAREQAALFGDASGLDTGEASDDDRDTSHDR